MGKYHILGKRWFRKSFGNTYHSVRIFENGEEIAYLPPQYGYEQQYLQTAIEWLAANRGIKNQFCTRYLREEIGATWEVKDVAREKDL